MNRPDLPPRPRLLSPEKISARDYELIRSIIHTTSRVNLGENKTELVCARIRKRLRATGIPSIRQYCSLIRQGLLEDEIPHLIDVTTTNHTFFFREPEHFDFLREHILPEFRKAQVTDPGLELRLWSAACSSGEEPYSLAITLAECLGLSPKIPWRIFASDISSVMVETARMATYRAERMTSIGMALRKKYFIQDNDSCTVIEALRRRVLIRQLNLLEDPAPAPHPFDVIFCRNVMIYFDRPTQQQLLERLSASLRPGGYLIVGHAEGLSGIRKHLTLVKPSILRNQNL
ncbi:MAG: protein-glutamate O-methyltransferase CheR [Verrucomicrobiae bacterium]|nr:protein-glutamate O-methyltransferase CheR [Verrucomicrobiae bacterium]